MAGTTQPPVALTPDGTTTPPVALTLAGTDSGGGAGVAADLRTFAALGVFGACAVTAVTAQDTVAVHAVHAVPPSMVIAQVVAVADDLPVAAVKVGMLATAATVEAVADLASAGRLPNLVVDPVLVASTGAALADAPALDVLRQRLLPLAAVVTPNVPEAVALLGDRARGSDDPAELARRLGDLGTGLVVVTGGHHHDGDEAWVVDVGWDGHQLYRWPHQRVRTDNTHGTGCTFSAALCAWLARGVAPAEAAAHAGRFVERALRGARRWRLGRGSGPLDTFGWAAGSAEARAVQGPDSTSSPTAGGDSPVGTDPSSARR
jgi:hydroxymethylpyrimidine/phosphomethylpyrimidine kinase